METTRLETFSDGVIAIIITIMVLELKAPHELTFAALAQLWPLFFSYALSFVLVAIYWVNHHHLLVMTPKVTGRVMWLNLHLLFWLSLIPFASAYLGENQAGELPVAYYAFINTGASAAFWLLSRAVTPQQEDADLRGLLRRTTRKSVFSVAINGASVAVAFVYAPLAIAMFLIPPLMHMIPDRQVERKLN